MASRTADGRRVALLAFALAAATLAVYWQCRDFAFVNWDDNVLVSSEPRVAGGVTGASLAWAATAVDSGNWMPVTRVSWMLDASLFGADAGAFHRTNVLLHALDALLLFVALARYTNRTGRSALVAAIFALHPLNVETVAWVSERKGLLCAAFSFLCLLAYRSWLEDRSSRLRYAALVASFALALASKPVAVAVPFALLLLDAWPLARWRRDAAWPLVREKLPLFALSAAASAVAYAAQARAGAVRPLDAVPLGARLANAAVAAVAYLRKTVWPDDLSPLYPFDPSIPAWKAAAAAALLVAITAGALSRFRRRPYLAVGWLWFVVLLAPVVGIVAVGEQSMADRYAYLPLVGIAVSVVWLVGDLLSAPGVPVVARRAAVAVAAVVLFLLARTASIQARVWHDSISLFDRAIALAPASATSRGLALALNNRGLALAESGRYPEARRDLEDAVRLDPSNAPSRNNLGNELARAGELGSAEAQYRAAVEIDPRYAEAYTNLGNVLCIERRVDEGIDAYRAALDADPRNRNALYNLATALTMRGDLEGAARQLEAVLSLDPSDATARAKLEQLRAAGPPR